MLDKLLSTIRRYHLVDAGDTVICAVSGGADSMALLFAMYLLREKLDIRLQAVHFNHNLRGAESDADEAFVRAFCAQYDIELFVGSGQVTAGKKGLESAARDARYGFFQSLSGKIATAHTADDNAETVLMRLVRGTGLKGLGAIAPMRGNIIRPMLNVTRQEILAFLEEYHLTYRQDSSNDGDDFLRNRLRHHVMPLLKEENPRLAENLSAMALRLRQDEEALSVMAEGESDVQTLRTMQTAIRSRALERILKESGVKEPEASHIALLESVVFSENPSAQAKFSGGVTIRRQYDKLIANPEQPSFEPVILTCPGTVQVAGYEIVCEKATQIINDATIVTVNVREPIIIRSRQSGDTIRLSGGRKSLKKLFIDRKIPAVKRNQIPILTDSHGVIAVCGIGANQERKATELPAWQIRFIERG